VCISLDYSSKSEGGCQGVYRELTLCVIVGLITQTTHKHPITILHSGEDSTQASHRYITSHIVREHHESVTLVEDCNFHGSGRPRHGIIAHAIVIGVVLNTDPDAYCVAIGALKVEQTKAGVVNCLFHAPILAPLTPSFNT